MAQHWQLFVGSTCSSSLFRSTALFVQALSRLHARESSRGAQTLSHRSYHAESTIFLVSPCPFREAVELVSGTPQHVLLVLEVWRNKVQPSHLGLRSVPDGCAVLWTQCHALCCCCVFAEATSASMLQASHLRPGTLFADKYLIGRQRRRSTATFTVAAEVRNDPYGDEGMEVWHRYRAAGCGKHRLLDYSRSLAGTTNVAFVCQQLSNEHGQGSLNAAAGRLCTPEDDLMKAAARRFCAPAVPTKQDTRSCCNASQWCTSGGLQSKRQSVQILAWQTGGLDSRCCCRCPLGSSLTKRHSKQSRTSITLQPPCPQQSAVCCHRYVCDWIHPCTT